MAEIIVFAGSSIGSVLSLLEQIKKKNKCTSYVVCLNSEAQPIFEKSCYVDGVKTLWNSNEEEFFHEFKNWFYQINPPKKPVVYFTTDTSCFLVNLYRDWFESNCTLCLPSSEIITTFTKKGVAELAAKDNGLSIPKTAVIQKVEDLKEIVNSFVFPVIIKPRSAYESQKAPFKVKILNQSVFYEETKDYLSKGYSFVCQEYIPGNDDSAYFYIFYRSLTGKINSVVGRKVLQNPPRAGIMAKGLIEDNVELTSQCKVFLEKIDYKGLGGLEFKKFDEKYYFIEMSTRLEGFFKISSIANVPMGLISYNDLCGIEEDAGNLKLKQQNGGIYIDLKSMIGAHKRNNSYFKLFLDSWSLVFNKKYQLNVYSNNDRKPFFSWLKKFIN
ncbi:hypothetical protein MWU78_15435 [Arenibacter sp. F26102]|uniref:hypothetical protein n=1 Tax=Arenibacter sp. F26102 TaxID=2926416 RepID=UPI001FF15448|nr:hypothetical protein [Arenibacter sp. F26102]MCK0147048.1 hypothetical protein [Arenibacter sp. F26102]